MIVNNGGGSPSDKVQVAASFSDRQECLSYALDAEAGEGVEPVYLKGSDVPGTLIAPLTG